MKQTNLKIGHIPALLWGERSDRLILAVHGNMSHKGDTVIALLAGNAVEKGYQVLSFDLPEHGDRKSEPTLCKARVCAAELSGVLAFARTQAKEVSLFGCSMGTYFSLLAFQDEPLRQALFLSPVVDMARLIQNMMTWFSISEQKLQEEREIVTPMGQTLYWDDYCYVKEHPITRWTPPAAILYGSADDLCEQAVVFGFAKRFDCTLTVLEAGEHFFHTPEQLCFYETWLKGAL